MLSSGLGEIGDAQPPDARQVGRRREQRIEPAGREHEALGARRAARCRPRRRTSPIRERASDASNDTSPVVMSMMPAKSACRSMIAASGSGTAIRNSPMITTATGIREREHDAGGHRDDRDRTAPTELQDRRRPGTAAASPGTRSRPPRAPGRPGRSDRRGSGRPWCGRRGPARATTSSRPCG